MSPALALALAYVGAGIVLALAALVVVGGLVYLAQEGK